jgi:hypothetical protein
MKIIQRTIMVSALVWALATNLSAQTNPQFIAATQTDEQAIRLTWASQPNHVYQIQCADSLIDTNTGTITWQTLYDDYPSQGTNTFWLDTGNYNLAPAILHPKNMPTRFYRVMDKGADTTSDEPSVSITSPANGDLTTGELTITVIASTDQPVLSGTKLYVDGQEMRMADSTTSYVDSSTNYEVDTYSINTCEWGNETHILFATAECESGYGDAVNSPPIASGHAVSAYVPVIFSNLVTRISFSQPSFDPSSGQTQQVSAVFAANSDWTLTIRDLYSNAVRTVTGSGNSLQFNWDGNGDGGATLPAGIYFYYISAQTNGESSDVVEGPGSSSGGGVPSPSFARSSALNSNSSSSMQQWAVSADLSGMPVPLALYPPGSDTSGLIIFEATPSEIQSLTPSAPRAKANFAMNSGISPASASAPASQKVPVTPLRPPTNPVRGLAGSFGVVYDTYSANGTNDFSLGPLDNGLHGTGHISMNNSSASSSLRYAPLLSYKAEANNFISQMQYWGWNNTLLKVDDQLNINDLRGSGSPLNNVNLAIFLSHGVYGTGSSGIDYAANGCKQMYYPVTSGGGAQYLRLSEMNLGGSGTSGLKWMALLSCNSLQHNNWANMQNLGVKPYNGNLHLLLGVDTTNYTSSNLLWYWAKYMNYGTSTNANSASPLTIREAWYQAGKDAYGNAPSIPPSAVIKFAVAGDSACIDDSLQTNNAPQGSWTYPTPVQVYPRLQ